MASVLNVQRATVPDLVFLVEKARMNRRISDGLVYFAKCGNKLKIGYSKNIGSRLSNLTTANAERVVLLGWIKGSRELESDIHLVFNQFHCSGEWFLLTEEVLLAVKIVAQQGTPPIVETPTPHADEEDPYDLGVKRMMARIAEEKHRTKR